MRILHTADWHLGRIFHGIHLTDDQAYVLEQFVQLAGDVKPDVIVIAGDVYDRAVPPTDAVKLLNEVISRIILDCKIPVLLIAGNHDSPERLGFGTRLLARQGLFISGQPGDNLAPIILQDAYGPVYFCAIPYTEPSVIREALAVPEAADHNSSMLSLLKHCTASIPRGSRTVAVAHAYVAGGESSESERPLTIGGTGMVDASCFQSFNYVALGHLHKPQKTGDGMCYAGSLLKYSFSESSHQKSINFVEMDEAGNITLDKITLSPRRDVRCLEGYIKDILAGPKNGESKEDYIMVTLKDTGAILDAIGKLREVYPNVLHIERPPLLDGGEIHGPRDDHRQISDMDLFSSFFEQVAGVPLTGEEARTFAETVDLFYPKEQR
ncbi:exonuclease SbcCD subunit D [Pelotomaculum isophthalicicum JI]|uniref:Nuclease SbcCD subunit D n=1 Tax=Pelotomaculum isophthalicicum JI TaxID=947010 RepID=A0A9X4GZG3_9FIRM|nr:exonuclease SbcCD subunit D [Pelotomaculum isophthalicicum]MDF9408750.1 exonuclease SbcCD subunit D [Pelotomaculum isophthalicicum JI]